MLAVVIAVAATVAYGLIGGVSGSIAASRYERSYERDLFVPMWAFLWPLVPLGLLCVKFLNVCVRFGMWVTKPREKRVDIPKATAREKERA